MGGIAGCYQQTDGHKLVDLMAERIAHRGPDAAGRWDYEDDRVAVQLGQRRLAVVDPSAITGPLTKNGLTLVYDGELYNAGALRTELAARGTRFTTGSDTEVLLEAWRTWGPDALGRFRGMFAFALFDDRSGDLILARDPFGIKPLYFLPRGSGLLFASELKAIVSAVGPELRMEPGALVASMLYHWLPEQHCAIQNVEKLPGGSWARLRPDGNCSIRYYWRAANVAVWATASPPADLKAVIEASVAAHLASDVPVATFLSGGLDSSIVTALAHRDVPAIEAYTIAPGRGDRHSPAISDDTAHARVLAARHGITLHEVDMVPDLVNMLPRIVDALDEPIAEPAAIGIVLMSEAARARGAKVMLSGTGADELFGGYRRHLDCVLADRYGRLPASWRSVVRGAVDRVPAGVTGRGVRWARRFLTFAELPEEPRYRRSYTLYDPVGLTSLISPDLAGYVGDLVASHQHIYRDNTLTDEINRMCLADTRLFLPGLSLASMERAGMAASVEMRFPFVDPEVARVAFAIPGRAKIHRQQGKIPLRRAAEGWLPAEIAYRPRASLRVPLRTWIHGGLLDVTRELLVHGELAGSGMIRRDVLLGLIRDEQAGREDRSRQLWQLLILELWHRHARALGVAG